MIDLKTAEGLNREGDKGICSGTPEWLNGLGSE